MYTITQKVFFSHSLQQEEAIPIQTINDRLFSEPVYCQIRSNSNHSTPQGSPSFFLSSYVTVSEQPLGAIEDKPHKESSITLLIGPSTTSFTPDRESLEAPSNKTDPTPTSKPIDSDITTTEATSSTRSSTKCKLEVQPDKDTKQLKQG